MGDLICYNESGRAWVEIDPGAVVHNAHALKALLPDGCEMMAVVKTDAYGHGAAGIAKMLWDEGVRAFAVATVDEGVDLRKEGITGNILVLGYAPACHAVVLADNELELAVVDGVHARELDGTGVKLRVHIAIDTGMHRFGVEPRNIAEIEDIFRCRNLTVVGTGSHLAVPDSQDSGDVEFTNRQIKLFYDTIDALREKGHDVGKVHVQASYAVCNYPGLQCDYARIGIMLYGVMSDYSQVKVRPDLRPVLSLRARIAQVRCVEAGESVSYGRIYSTARPSKLATVCIGYADGVSRQMSGNGGMCIVNGIKVPVVGRVCMDLLMIDVTDAGCVRAGDAVTLIGRDGGAEIRCEDFAAASGTITNEVLCRLGGRLPRVILKSKEAAGHG